MTIYVGPPFKCLPATADLARLEQGAAVAHLTADTVQEMKHVAHTLDLTDSRELGAHTVRWRWLVTRFERNRAIHQLDARELTAQQMYLLEASRRTRVR